MKCHYEVLEVPQDADDAAIKAAYRKLALRWHPDKNMQNAEEAKRKFQVIQQAYEVLSDAQERSWYDRHREQIIRGSDEYADNSLDVFQYFSAACYRGHTNAAGAFYAVYAGVFERLATEDLDFVDTSDRSYTPAPAFGNADSDYETVVGPFYAYWMSYCTAKSYAWLCQHNVNEIRDRRVLRHIEKETAKLAQKARRERNDEVRALVAFVRKRDRRVAEWQRVLAERATQNRLKTQQQRLAQIERNRAEVAEQVRLQKEAGVTAFGDDYERQLRKMEAAYRDSDDDEDEESYEDSDAEDGEEDEEEEDDGEISEHLANGATIEDAQEDEGDDADDADDDDDEYIDHLYCVACNKSFKSDSQFENHNESKKHKDNIKKLRQEMLNDEKAHRAAQSDDGDASTSDKDEIPKKSNKQSKKARRKVQKVIATPAESEAEDETVAAAPVVVDEEVTADQPYAEAQDPSISSRVVSEDEDDASTKLTKKAKRRAKKTASAAAPAVAPTPKPNASKKSGRRAADSSDSDDDTNNTTAANDDWDGTRRGKGKNRAAARKSKSSAVKSVDIDEIVDVDHTCVTCGRKFDSKNRLFAHLKAENHGVYIAGKGVTPSRVTAAAAAAAAEAMASAAGRSGRRK